MYWQDDTPKEEIRIADDMVDLRFALKGRQIPVDHAYALSRALQAALPWLAEEPRAAVHLIHVAGSQNGWQRPDELLHLSRRTKLTLRLPKERLADAEALVGATLDLNGHRVELGATSTHPLSGLSTLLARYVVCEPDEAEEAFLSRAVAELSEMGIRVKKALCGMTTSLSLPEGPIQTRSLMLADLSIEESIRLQQQGLGLGRHMGCGIFIPHKGIDPVKKAQERG
jgi:CRISPR-associated protein Cas6